MLIGADPDQLDALANQMDSDAQTLDQLRGRVGTVLENLLWQGADAHEFFEAWAQRFSGMVGNAAAALRDAARCLHAEAVQQREASGEDAGFSILDPIGFTLTAGSVAADVAKRVDVAVEELGKIKITAADLEVAGPVMAIAGAGLDVANFVRQYSANPDSPQTLTAGWDMGLGLGGGAVGAVELGAIVAGVELAPAIGFIGLGLGVAEVGNEAISTFDPRFDEQVLGWGKAVASTAANGVRDALSLIRRNPLSWVPTL